MEKVLIRYKTDSFYPYPLNADNCEGDAGVDLRVSENVYIAPGEYITVGTGLYMEIPEGMVGLVCPRSGLAVKHGLSVIIGVIDCGYRGEIKITLVNHGKDLFTASAGTRMAQLVIVPALFASNNFRLEEVAELSSSERGSSGFGSTGI